jgi:hypothetical protein
MSRGTTPTTTEPTTTVVNVRDAECDVYVGRPMPGRRSRYGNPFKTADLKARHNLNDDQARKLAVALYRNWVLRSEHADAVWIRAHVHELRGKRLGCWCAPLPCHAEVLAELAESAASL